MKFYEKLILLRKQKGVSQEELADFLDVSRQAVYKWESGTNMPDISKLEKMTEYFNVSFNYLLDETMEEQDSKSKQTAGKVDFRSVYVSENELDCMVQSNYEHGYAKDTNRRIKNSESIFAAKYGAMHNAVKEKGYTNLVPLQDDICLCYFENPQEKTFGFYFDGAEQFVCPFENYIDAQVTCDNHASETKRKPIIGVGLGTITVGAMAQTEAQRPMFYYLTVLYFDKDGNSCEYKLSLGCLRGYTVWESNHYKEMIAYTSEITERRTAEVLAKLKGVKAQGEFLQNNDVGLQEVDTDAYQEANAKATAQTKEAMQKLTDENQAIKKRKKKGNLIFLGVVAGIVAIILAVSMISSALEKRKANKALVAPVVELIDQIGEVTLDDGELLLRIEAAYNALTETQQDYVENYDTYLAALERYTTLDPSSTITLADLCGTWENDRYIVEIANVGDKQAVCCYIYDKQTNSDVLERHTSGTPSLAGSSLSGYNMTTHKMEGKLLFWFGLYVDEHKTFAASKDTNGTVTLSFVIGTAEQTFRK